MAPTLKNPLRAAWGAIWAYMRGDDLKAPALIARAAARREAEAASSAAAEAARGGRR
jgi:hypothetical protein